MGKLLSDVNSLINDINTNIDSLLQDVNEINRLYEDEYMLKEVRDPNILKEKMKEKIRLGIREHDSE